MKARWEIEADEQNRKNIEKFRKENILYFLNNYLPGMNVIRTQMGLSSEPL